MEITQKLWKPGFQWNPRLRNTVAFSSVIKPITPEFWKTFPKGINKNT